MLLIFPLRDLSTKINFFIQQQVRYYCQNTWGKYFLLHEDCLNENARYRYLIYRPQKNLIFLNFLSCM